VKEHLKVVCVNARNKPADFPSHLWVVERVEIYTVVEMKVMVKQPGVLGFVLKERDLSGLTKYDSFDSRRFRPATEQDFEDIDRAQVLLEELEESLVAEGANTVNFSKIRRIISRDR
jgi:hypothetical protein